MSDIQAMQFGRYELLERLGAGGMAEVYRARYTAAPGVTRPVVIKRIMSHCAQEPAFVEMFLNEARISVGLSHGNIVQVFDFGQVDGEYFLAMELVDGQSLSAMLKKAKAEGIALLPAPLAVGIVIEICRGLHYAHTRVDEQGEPLGLVHRDISPDNVLLSYEGEVKLADFGIAKARLAGRVETEAGVVKGKYLYFSPEQAKGEPLDARSDVYAVGVVLYQMLCGRRPAEGVELEVMRRIVEGQLTPAKQLNPLLDEQLWDILRKALATSREERYLTAEALHLALAGWMGTYAPLFPAHMRKHLLRWLFREQLAAQRRPPVLPPEFSQLVERWRAEVPPPPEKVPWEVAAVPLDLPLPAPRRMTLWPGQGTPSADAPVTEPELIRPSRWKDPSVQRAMQSAALTALGLFILMGGLAWRDYSLRQEQEALMVRVPPDAPVPKARLAHPAVVIPTAAPVDATGLPVRVVLEARRYSFRPAGHGSTVVLNPGRPYMVWTEGKYQPDRPWEPEGTSSHAAVSERLLVLLDSEEKLPARWRLQLVSANPLLLRRAFRLQAFGLRVGDWSGTGSGTVGLKLRDELSSNQRQVQVQVSRDSVEVPLSSFFIVKGLQPSRSYTVEVRPRQGAVEGPVVMLKVSADRPVQQSHPEWLHVLDVGSHQVSGAQELLFTLPLLPEFPDMAMEVQVE